MNVSRLITNLFKKTNYITINHVDGLNFKALFKLNIPAYTDDSKLLNQFPNSQIRYYNTKKCVNSAFTVTKDNIDAVKSSDVSNNKKLIFEKDYNLKNLISEDGNINEFFWNEYNILTKELKAELLLEKIGDLTKEWNNVLNGIPNVKIDKQPYGRRYLNRNFTNAFGIPIPSNNLKISTLKLNTTNNTNNNSTNSLTDIF